MARYSVRVRGTDTMLQHRYPLPEEEERFKADCEANGLDPKRTDNIDGFWYHNGKGAFIPSEHLKGALIGAGKGVKIRGKGNATWNNLLKVNVAITPAEIFFDPQKPSYDFVDRRYVNNKGSRVLRGRPAFAAGWEAEFTVETTSEISEKDLRSLLNAAGRRGIGDFRAERGGSFGLFEVTKFELLGE